jgi:hypothetical protein
MLIGLIPESSGNKFLQVYTIMAESSLTGFLERNMKWPLACSLFGILLKSISKGEILTFRIERQNERRTVHIRSFHRKTHSMWQPQ